MKTSVAIDWISCTYTGGARKNSVPSFLRSAKWSPTTPARGYTGARQFVPSGVKENWHDTRADMGHHLIYSGSSLRKLEEHSVSTLTLLGEIVDTGGKVTRIDLALDLHDSALSLATMQQHFEDGLVTTNARKIVPVGRVRASQGTLYVGSRTSESFLRIYDKAAEQSVTGDWIRVELELKGSKAEKAVWALRSNDMAQYIPAVIKGFCNWYAIDAWNEALKVEPEVMVTDKKQTTDTRRWLIETCAPALAKWVVMNSDYHTLHEFLQTVNDEIISLGSRLQSNEDDALT